MEKFVGQAPRVCILPRTLTFLSALRLAEAPGFEQKPHNSPEFPGLLRRMRNLEDSLTERDGFEPAVPLVLCEVADSRQFSVSPQLARLNGAGDGLDGGRKTSDVCVCRRKRRADIRRNPSRREPYRPAEELAALEHLGTRALKQHWRILYRTEPPARISRSLSAGVVYRLQEQAWGGLKLSTRRRLERIAADSGSRSAAQPPATVTPGTGLIREWHEASLAMTARWHARSRGRAGPGPRFFGLNGAR